MIFFPDTHTANIFLWSVACLFIFHYIFFWKLYGSSFYLWVYDPYNPEENKREYLEVGNTFWTGYRKR